MIYTSYYGQLKELAKKGIEPVAVSRSVPKNFAGRRLTSLAPTWRMLDMDDEDYDREYEKILAYNNADEVVKYLGDGDVALLCWEKNINDCHRKRIGEWLRENGYEVKEYEKENGMRQITLNDIFPPLA